MSKRWKPNYDYNFPPAMPGMMPMHPMYWDPKKQFKLQMMVDAYEEAKNHKKEEQEKKKKEHDKKPRNQHISYGHAVGLLFGLGPFVGMAWLYTLVILKDAILTHLH